jgi:peptide deformylase
LEADGLLARVLQHETDHLNGKLFIDRLGTAAELEVRDVVREFEVQFASQQERGEAPGDAEIKRRLEELERLRT